MNYNFDIIISREATDCEKFDARDEVFGRADVIPMWVADMDFAVPEAVTEAIVRRAGHPIYGYTFRSDGYFRSVIDWVGVTAVGKWKRSGSTSLRAWSPESFSRCVLSRRRATGW